jgi:hypothetical protein
MKKHFCRFLGALAVALAAGAGQADAAQPQAQGQAHVDVNIQPFASLHFLTPNALELTVPPSKSTINTSGAVQFVVDGNARATLTAAPSQFLYVTPQPGGEGGWMGEAANNGHYVGYQVQLTFPSNGVMGSPKAIAAMPLSEPAGTTPALSVYLPLTAGQRPGTVDLLANANWTADGGLPLPGAYVGQIILTLTADNP